MEIYKLFVDILIIVHKLFQAVSSHFKSHWKTIRNTLSNKIVTRYSFHGNSKII